MHLFSVFAILLILKSLLILSFVLVSEDTKCVRCFGESFNMDSEQEMYFTEKTNRHGLCSGGKDL